MANAFTKEERAAWEDILQGFEDALTISRNVSTYGTNGELMERAKDTIWRPMPYIINSQDRVIGTPITTQDVTQLSVPSRLSYKKSVPWTMDALELRDALQENRLGKAAYERIASDVNTAVRDVVSLQGTLVVDIPTAAGSYDDIALAESMMDEQGIPKGDRYLALTTRDYNGLAGNLVGSARSFGNKKTDTAYEKSYVGDVAGFMTYKTDGGKRLGANGATVTIDTTGAQVAYVPKATDVNNNNVDNRYQTVTVSTTTGVTAGDCFTVAGIDSVHHITKEDTGQLKTFRVISVDSGTTMTISPPIIGATGSPTDAEKAYKNVEVTATSATAAITFLNTAATNCNPFWHRDSVQLLMGRYAIPENQGVAVLRSTTKQGLEVVMTKKFDSDTFVSKYSVDTFFGVVNLNPEQNGVIVFNT